ncbi:MAG: response regulator [Prevotella sp.]|jgi:signal transduction histidine kinase/ligand-binding sensor domain-containing protein/DNA-binding response OmpR family regulator|nr:response regulator [Prevotella sp.]MCI1281137.1 response regulator [Prevotella sp.]
MKIRTIIIILAFLAQGIASKAQSPVSGLAFNNITVSDGLSSNRIQSIFKDSYGFIWIGTEQGLNRYDGFRFKTFFSQRNDPLSLPNNSITKITEDAEKNLWINTSIGYCIYDHKTESFSKDVNQWMTQHGMKETPIHLSTDASKNLWIHTRKHVYYYDFHTHKATVFNMGSRKGMLPNGEITDLFTIEQYAIASYNNGILAKLDSKTGRIIWVNYYLRNHGIKKNMPYRTFIDRQNNYWVFSGELTIEYSASERKWKYISNKMVTDILQDQQGRIWMATDHDGIIIDGKTVPNVLSDNTLRCLYLDDWGTVWIGTYKCGVAYHYEGQTTFEGLPLGDVCTITQDDDGNYWCGTNDKGLIFLSKNRQIKREYKSSASHLGSDIIVSSLHASDGSIWFGSFRGGLARYQNGTFHVWREQAGGLCNDNVWSLAEDHQGNIIIGTLGSGIQIFNPMTGKFTTYNRANSGLASDYVSSVCVDYNDDIIIGHSLDFTIFDRKAHKMRNIHRTQHGQELSSPTVNQVFVDSRQLIWIATASGLNVYDRQKDEISLVSMNASSAEPEICSISEDLEGSIWITTANTVKRIYVNAKDNGWNFFMNSFSATDGLQSRLFNQRSIYTTESGDIIVGGMDGINIISPQLINRKIKHSNVVFSGLVIFDHTVSVGEQIDGRTILKESLNTTRNLKLKSNLNVFTIQLAASNAGIPENCRFQYRLQGYNDRWTYTAEKQPSISFNNLEPGKYELEVRIVDFNGNPQSDISTLQIHILPPFYRTWWAYLLYILFLASIAWWFYHQYQRKRQEERERMENEKQKELSEMKQTFFTNLSHELRTPLTLIISPLSGIIRGESDDNIRSKLQIIERNAHHLLDMVNQMLDTRRIMVGAEKLNLKRGDIVSFVNNICNQFKALEEKKINLNFTTDKEQFFTDFDNDKIGKIVNNLLSNAYKFTPDGGTINVALTSKEQIDLTVADNGIGISDEDKKHIFERFFQASNKTASGGSGIGLNLVFEYARMHGGSVTVADNPGGGTVFHVMLPIRKEQEEVIVKTEKKADNQQRELLLVDDSADFLEFMVSELSDEYHVTTAVNGVDALQKIEEKQPDVILSDVMMPEMDGNQLCQNIKRNPRLAGIPVIILTARLSEENELESRECGADDYITKPFNIDLLRVHIRNLVNHKQLSSNEKIEPQITESEITSMDEQLVKDATAYVEKNLDNSDLSVEMMSEDLNMSRVKLYRRLLTVTGKTPSEFIRLIRLRHAEQLLCKSQLSISEIAFSVGFASLRYFSKCFKDLYGHLPSQHKDLMNRSSK